MENDKNGLTRDERWQKLVRALVNELCLWCGAYQQEHLGRCEGCRWKPVRHGDLTNEGIDTENVEEATK